MTELPYQVTEDDYHYQIEPFHNWKITIRSTHGETFVLGFYFHNVAESNKNYFEGLGAEVSDIEAIER